MPDLIEEYRRNKLEILGKLITSLAHEIRNPLSAIKLNLDFLEMSKDELNEEMIESVKHSQEAAERIQYLIDNLLNFARDKGEEVRKSLNEIAETAVELQTVKARSKNINLVKQFDYSVNNFKVPEKEILQVVLNLISNAIEACRPKRKVVVRTFKSHSENSELVVLEVEDEGIGIKPEDKNKIFKEFFTTKQDGTGLGLYVCKSIVEKYDAKIDFESIYKVGTKFKISFTTGGKE